MEIILHGGKDKFTVESKLLGVARDYNIDFEGVTNFIESQYKSNSTSLVRWAKEYMDKVKCPTCEGSRLRKESLYFKVDGKNIADLVNMDIIELGEWSKNLLERLSSKQQKISSRNFD